MSKQLARAIEALETWVGLGAKTDSEDRYAEVLFPHDAPAYRKGAARSMSSCALCAMAYLRALHIKHPKLDAKYEGRNDAVSTVVSVAKAVGAWVTPTKDTDCPNVGDAVIIGRNGDRSWGSPATEHVFVIASYDPEEGHFRCIEGGQGPGGTSIGYAHRIFLFPDKHEGLWAVRASVPYTTSGAPNGRRVYSWFDASRFLASLPPDEGSEPGANALEVSAAIALHIGEHVFVPRAAALDAHALDVYGTAPHRIERGVGVFDGRLQLVVHDAPVRLGDMPRAKERELVDGLKRCAFFFVHFPPRAARCLVFFCSNSSHVAGAPSALDTTGDASPKSSGGAGFFFVRFAAGAKTTTGGSSVTGAVTAFSARRFALRLVRRLALRFGVALGARAGVALSGRASSASTSAACSGPISGRARTSLSKSERTASTFLRVSRIASRKVDGATVVSASVARSAAKASATRTRPSR